MLPFYLGILPAQVKEFVGVSSHPRFRKRDKVLFYGRKMLRKVKSISGQVHQTKKRKLVMRFARKLLHLKKDTSSTQLQVGSFYFCLQFFARKHYDERKLF